MEEGGTKRVIYQNLSPNCTQRWGQSQLQGKPKLKLWEQKPRVRKQVCREEKLAHSGERLKCKEYLCQKNIEKSCLVPVLSHFLELLSQRLSWVRWLYALIFPIDPPLSRLAWVGLSPFLSFKKMWEAISDWTCNGANNFNLNLRGAREVSPFLKTGATSRASEEASWT